MDKYETNDAVNFALTGKPVEFETAVHQLLGQRIQDAIDAKREEVAQGIFAAPEEDETPADDVPADAEATETQTDEE